MRDENFLCTEEWRTFHKAQKLPFKLDKKFFFDNKHFAGYRVLKGESDHLNACRLPSRILIYGLLDPRDHALRYVGKTHMRREHRLLRHLKNARCGSPAPVHVWMRELEKVNEVPIVFVLAKISGDEDWRASELQEILKWQNWSVSMLPYVHQPVTPKSTPTIIKRVALLNVIGMRQQDHNINDGQVLQEKAI